MKPISSSAELKQAITELERKTKLDEGTLKAQFGQTKEALRPQNVIRNSFASLAETPEVRKTVISTLIGFGLGYFSKKATEALQEDKLNRLMSALVEHGVNRVIQQNPDSLLAKGLHVTRHVAQQQGIKFF